MEEENKKPAKKTGDKPADKKPAKASAKQGKTTDEPVTPAETETPKAPEVTPEAAKPAVDAQPDKPEAKDDKLTESSPKGGGLSRRGWLIAGSTVVGLLVLFLAVFGVLIYKYKSDSRIVEIVSGVVPYPAERVNSNLISYASYLFEVKSIKHYYQSQTTEDNKPAVDFNTKEGKDRLKQLQEQVLQQLQQEAMVRQIAAKQKVTVSEKEVKEQVDQITKSAGGDEKVKEVLKKFYGWDQNDLKKKIRFQLLKQKTTEKLQNDESLNKQTKSKADDVLKQVQGGGDFAELAKKYSQDSSAANGGDLGTFGRGQMVKEFEEAAFKLEPGQTSELVKTQYGYHVIKVLEKNGDQVHAAHILVKGLDFDQYVQDELKKAKVQQFIKP